MKTSSYILLLSGLLGACQHAPEKGQSALPLMPVSHKTGPASPPATPAPSTLTAAQLAVLRATDLAPVWLPASYEDEDGLRSAGQAMNGFFGKEHRRIEFVFTRVERDTQNPALYYIRGKDRYKQRVTPLEGTIELQRLAPLTPLKGSPNELAAAYSATGRFELREVGTADGAGVFRGKVAVDFGRGEAQKVEVVMWGFSEASMKAGGAGTRFEGEWTSNQTKQTKPVLWADAGGLFDIAQDVFADFNVGERGPSINPKYAKLGWDNYWENEEWWAETPKTVSL